MKRIIKKYNEVKHLINEGDILLYRGNSFVSRMINAYGGGIHSHVAIASWSNGGAKNGILECLEFKEWKGSRATSLERQVWENNGLIDVFRVSPTRIELNFDSEADIIKSRKVLFDAKAITNCMRRLTGLPYGYKRIWWIARHKLPLMRLLYDIEASVQDSSGNELINPVCSTSISYCFSKNNFDLVKNRHYNWTEPADIARSNLLNYLFTLEI